MGHDPYWFELESDVPEGWKMWRDAMFALYATVPVPGGVETIEDSSPRRPNEVTASDGSEVRYYVTPYETIMATLVHPVGYAEFSLVDGQWHYESLARILMQGWEWFDVDEIDAAEVTVEPPTLAIAQVAAQADPELQDRVAFFADAHAVHALQADVQTDVQAFVQAADQDTTDS